MMPPDISKEEQREQEDEDRLYARYEGRTLSEMH
jgi:hypothetical protein